ncbi:hypothetical protein GCM10010123_38880 [Pilimelia anulata]|uniref:Uncharacterized protein n=1 Tax=Pilimelia anulata TaxID=53371 RepID=A0A8J3FDP9_9ACTN|nr:hypothetical protein [Pilimelia anulata]GGK05261.1 hypothetical protein GCM10010123_38880 [Pilimelia anulata]
MNLSMIKLAAAGAAAAFLSAAFIAPAAANVTAVPDSESCRGVCTTKPIPGNRFDGHLTIRVSATDSPCSFQVREAEGTPLHTGLVAAGGDVAQHRLRGQSDKTYVLQLHHSSCSGTIDNE